MSEVLLGVSGGIAAYKAVEILRLLQRRGHKVTVVMTRAACRFVGTATFAALSGRPVGTDPFGSEGMPGYDHLDLARRADVMVVAPASANTLARLAHGMSQGMLGAAYLAFDGPVIVAPAMNTRMYLHPATADNLALLMARGVQVVPPEEGPLADGDVGVGRLADPAVIADAVDQRLKGAFRLSGRKVLVSAGGTREPIDAVRYVGNSSSGKMGWAVADAAHRAGADVTVLAANVELHRTPGIDYVEVTTAAEMHDAAMREFPRCDLLVMAAAVADYRPMQPRAGKIDKAAQEHLTIDLAPTDDILSELTARKGERVVVGFAAEHGPEGLARAREKRERKGLDLIVHNDISLDGVGFGSDENRVTIIGDNGQQALPRMTKQACAERIVAAAAALLPPPA